jgi:hypothetical protein
MPRDFLHNHPQFADLIRIVADSEGIAPALVEKDYWIMQSLYGLQQLGSELSCWREATLIQGSRKGALDGALRSERSGVAVDRAAAAEQAARGRPRGRPAGDQRDLLRAADRLALAGSAEPLRPTHHGLQPLQQMVILGSSVQVELRNPPYRKFWMTTATPLTRYSALWGLASRAASLPPSYTRDTTWHRASRYLG